MRIGIIATRLSGTDGVSLEVQKTARVLRGLGHDVFFCAGELGGYASGGILIPELHFKHPAIQAVNQRAFVEKNPSDCENLLHTIESLAVELERSLDEFVQANRLDLLFIENALAIPMNLPLGLALTNLIQRLNIPAIGHHHDFYWERARYQDNNIFDLLDAYFPPDLPNLRHATINSIAQSRLKARRGLDSIVIPNVHDFATPPPVMDDFNADFRFSARIGANDLLVFQPTRVIQRKGIELAIELVHHLCKPNARLLIAHSADDEGLAYFNWLKREAQAMGVDLRFLADITAEERRLSEGRKTYAMWDIYSHANLVTYPSLYEGFGNALLEAVYFKRLVVVNRYPVYNADIYPLGFEFIELDGYVSQQAVAQTLDLLADPSAVRAIAEKNYAIAQEHFSLQVLEQKLVEILSGM